MKKAIIKSNSILSRMRETFEGLRSILVADNTDDQKESLESFSDFDNSKIIEELIKSQKSLDKNASDYVSNIGVISAPKQSNLKKSSTITKKTISKIEPSSKNIETSERNIYFFKNNDELDR
ncbi:MAG: hypothetical protein GX682_02005 [Clostridiaceae bacterium]|nr:hypothetical protein [Clostridiaceae bacterium]